MKTIRKVDVTPIEKNTGKIIDSTSTTDDKTKNTYSMHVVDTLQNGVNEKVSKKPYYFNTVAEMKAYNLNAGDMAITKGYYEENDGGAAEYEIVSSASNYNEILNNNLKAKIIIKDNINVKQFGAKGDGIENDTSAIQNAINYLIQIYNNENSINTLSIPAGEYKITSMINLPIFINLRVIGTVQFTSFISNNPALWINSNSVTQTDKESLSFNKKIISGEGTLILKRDSSVDDVNSSTATSIGILIGDNAYNQNYLRVARFILENVTISGFNTAIKLNEQNTYLITFKNVRCELNNKSFVYGTIGTTYNNSGENISFYKCVFATSYNAIVNNTKNGDGSLNFNQCSFDFNSNVVLLNDGAHMIFNSCHFEGIGFNNEQMTASSSNTTGFGSLIYNNYIAESQSSLVHNSIIEINNPNLYLSSSNIDRLFKSIDNTSKYPLIVYFNNKQNLLYHTYNFNNILLNDSNCIIKNFDTRLRESVTASMVYNKNDQIGTLTKIPNDITKDTISNYDLGFDSISSLVIDTTDKVFNKSLKVSLISQKLLKMQRRIFNFNKDRIFTTFFFKSNLAGDNDTLSVFRPVITFKYYNDDNIEIGESHRIAYNAEQHVYKNDDTDWYAIKPVIDDIPINCCYIDIIYELNFRNSNQEDINCSGDIYLDGILVD